MNNFVFAVPLLLLIAGISYAYAEPLEVDVTVLEHDGSSATVKMTWNSDSSAAKYEIGCVSCSPKIFEISTENNITLSDITPFPNTSNALLYVIAYDSQEEIIDAKQILVDVGK